jgi:hypothetical protein
VRSTCERIATEVLARTRELYATCRSYRDVGEQTNVIVGSHLTDGRETMSFRYRTAFSRPSNLFFEFRSFWRGTDVVRAHGVLRATAERVEQWWNIGEEQGTHMSLTAAISTFAAISGGTARAVPSLLLPESCGRPTLPDPSSARVHGMDAHDGHDCFVIEGTRGRSNRPVTVWIDRSSLMLRRVDQRVEFDAAAYRLSVQRLRDYMEVKHRARSRIDLEARIKELEEHASPGFAAVITTTWRPEMDVELDPEMFEAQPTVAAGSAG